MTEFKVGDRVRYTGKHPSVHEDEFIGELGTVCGHLPSRGISMIKVNWDDHRVAVGAKYPKNLELVSRATKFQVGDTIFNSRNAKYTIIFIDDKGALVEDEDLGTRLIKNHKILGGYTKVIPERWVRVTWKNTVKTAWEVSQYTYPTEREARKGGSGEDSTCLAGVMKLENNIS